MNCPKCNRNFAAILSICPACGTMMNDSVREELELKISSLSKPSTAELKGKFSPVNKPLQPPATKLSSSASSNSLAPKPFNKHQPVQKSETMQINKATSPTLVDFQPKASALPEWKLQIQNAVRQRKDQRHTQENPQTSADANSPSIVHRTNGATALKVEVMEFEEADTVLHKNPTVNNALRRIEQSHKKFYSEEKPASASAEGSPKKDFPFYIAAKSDNSVIAQNTTPASGTPSAKPKLVSSLRDGKADFDTNKLPPIPQDLKISSSFESKPAEVSEEINSEKVTIPESKTDSKPDVKSEKGTAEVEVEEYDDNVPFAMRFNAGVFDILIGAFASLILLSPFMFFGGDWFTFAGAFAFLATTSVVLFIYMTTALGLFGKTFGMKIFSLELIDIEDNDYPTFHQAAVSSSVYLLSLFLGGSGFLTVPFTADGRAVHDIVSGTLVVREEEV